MNSGGTISRRALIGLSCALMLASVVAAQELPTPTAGSGAIHTRPLVPAQGEETRVIVTGEFQFGHGTTTLDVCEVVRERVTGDLSTSWYEGTTEPDEGG